MPLKPSFSPFRSTNHGTHSTAIRRVLSRFAASLAFRSVLLLALCLILVHPSSSRAQGSAGSKAAYESRVIVDMPTAGVVSKGNFGFNSIVFAGGGLLCDLSFAPIEDFNIGVGYSGLNILGSGAVTWQGVPSTHLRYRIVDETLKMPAILLGIQTQGRGVVSNRIFETAAPGLFVAASKQFVWTGGTLAFHAGAGYSMDLAFDGEGVNVWAGAEQSLGSAASLMAELNPTLNDTHSGVLLNLSLRWVITPGFTLELQGRDLLGELPAHNGFTRTMAFEINRHL